MIARNAILPALGMFWFSTARCSSENRLSASSALS